MCVSDGLGTFLYPRRMLSFVRRLCLGFFYIGIGLHRCSGKLEVLAGPERRHDGASSGDKAWPSVGSFGHVQAAFPRCSWRRLSRCRLCRRSG
jgi:hypothetical protein